MSELVSVCLTLPDFEMLHLVNFLLFRPTIDQYLACHLAGYAPPTWQQLEDEVMAKVDGVKDLAIELLRKANYLSARRKRVTFEAIELTPSAPGLGAVLLDLDIEVCQ